LAGNSQTASRRGYQDTLRAITASLSEKKAEFVRAAEVADVERLAWAYMRVGWGPKPKERKAIILALRRAIMVRRPWGEELWSWKWN
jgi:hypothetical protein